MDRNQKAIYFFIYDEAKEFYRAKQLPNGTWVINHNTDMYPLYHNPMNLKDAPVEFGTNKRYFSMNRSINYPLIFTLDGAAILNYVYETGKGADAQLYAAMFEFDPSNGIYKLSYNGRFDFTQKTRDHKLGTFTVPMVDDSAWGILSQNDDVEYSIDCSESNPKAIKVLFDNFTLQNRYTFQTVQAPITRIGLNNSFVIPFVLVNQDGDSFGIVAKSQTGDSDPNQTVSGPLNPGDYIVDSLNYFWYSFYAINGVNIQGNFVFTWSINNSGVMPMYIFLRTTTGQSFIIFQNLAGSLIVGQTYNIPFNINLNLAPGEKIFFMAQLNGSALNLPTITPIVTNIFVTTLTKAPTTICYALRPLDLLQEIVKKATLQRYTIGSDYFTVDNKAVIIPAEQFRGIRDSKIYTTFRDFFETYSALFFMALRVVNGSIFMELANEVYKRGTDIIDIGNIIELETSPATEFMANEIEVGSPKQDYRHPSGRLEFNSVSTFSVPTTNIKNKLSLITKYRTDMYGMIFLILDYKGNSTKDNNGDKTNFVVDITDELGSSVENVQTFENINVNNAPLAPIIKYPLTGDIINNDLPILKGVGVPGTNVNIYANNVLDGGTVVDGAGNWSYQMVTPLPSYDPGVFDGVAVIQATNTDLSAANDTIQLIIDTTVASPIGLTYPRVSDNLYNNLPLIRGVAPPGTNINILLDGALLAAVVADNSCKFEYKVVVPITNGSHTLNIGLGTVPVVFNVNSNVLYPLITYVGGELDGFPIVDNTPEIRGVAKPGETVTIWLNYITYNNIGTAIADTNGNWSYQTINTQYIDPVSGVPTTLVPIRNGLSVVSTLLINNSVPIAVSGFKLNRPNYTSITGVIDNTVFNTRFSNMRMLMNHKSLLSAMMDRQRNELIEFQTHDKNPNLRTILGTVVVTERADISPSSLGSPIAILENAKMKAISRKSFAEILYDFNNGGTVKGNWKGKTVYFLPIGSMKMRSIMDSVQEWNLLISPLMSYIQLLNLYKVGLTINLMQNAIFHSDYNSLHMVEYNYQQPNQYNFKSIYSDWFTNRNDAWLTKPEYIQKYQTDQVLRDQVITNGVAAMTLEVWNCEGPRLIATLNYNPVNPAPIPIPEICLEAVIDLSTYPVGQYFFVQKVGVLITAISERIETREKWLGTILIESTNSTNMPGVFYSTGFKTCIRVEGLVKKLQPKVDTVVALEEGGNSRMLWAQVAKKRMIRFGNAKGMPDYLAIKTSLALTNDSPIIEGTAYTLEDGEKINPSDDIPGVPMYYYDVIMTLKENTRGKVFPGGAGSDVTGVTLVVDASAIGLPGHSLIDLKEE